MSWKMFNDYRKSELSEEEVKEAIQYPEGFERPKSYEKECKGGPRPCPLVGCEANNFLWVGKRGDIYKTWPDKEPEDVDPKLSCAYDVADRDQSPEKPLPFEELAEALNLTRSGAQVSCQRIIDKLKLKVIP
jgi:hypothetical protein